MNQSKWKYFFVILDRCRRRKDSIPSARKSRSDNCAITVCNSSFSSPNSKGHQVRIVWNQWINLIRYYMCSLFEVLRRIRQSFCQFPLKSFDGWIEVAERSITPIRECPFFSSWQYMYQTASTNYTFFMINILYLIILQKNIWQWHYETFFFEIRDIFVVKCHLRNIKYKILIIKISRRRLLYILHNL